MRSRLQLFTNFANQLLPHETGYLLSIQQFTDEDRYAILQRVDHNCRHIDQFTPFDDQIDKRKYNHLQNWIKERLAAIDVDQQYQTITEWEGKILTDTIDPTEEKRLLKKVTNFEQPDFFFIRFYELIEHYRHFLQIRLRYQDYQLVNDFLAQWEATYQHSKSIYQRLNTITSDVVQQYETGNRESQHWEDELESVFMEEQMDGLNRYLAFVRLTFIAFNYRNYSRVTKHFDYLDQAFAKGQHYSKRILLNYYSNRLLLHSQLKDYKTAVYYGKLSVRSENHDYLFYVNNLAAVMLRLNQNHEALELLKPATPKAKLSTNYHNRIGFVAFFIEALLKNGLYKNAETYGDTFINAYAKEVLRYRWHLFFSIYLSAILIQGKSDKALKVAKKYKLEEKDNGYIHKASYLPSIPLLLAIARCKEGLLSEDNFHQRLQQLIATAGDDPSYQERFGFFMTDLKTYFPEVRILKPKQY